MGQDIHIKSFVWTKIEQKYIDGMSFSDSPQYSAFRPFFDGRYYDFFSLFGSLRGNFKPLGGAIDGYPDFLPKTYLAYLDQVGSDYHTFSWFDISTLKREMEIYIDKLKDPLKYYSDDECIIESIKTGEFNQIEWKNETKSLISTLKKCIKNIQEIFWEDEYLKDLIDVEKTIFVICFDN